MQRIDNDSAVAVRPEPQAAGTPGFFGRGDPSDGTKPTVVTADFLNMIQEELATIVTAANLTLNKTDVTQVWTALQRLLATRSEIAQSLVQNGYYTFPKPTPDAEQLILQWGFPTSSATANGSVSVTFPIEFPNSNLGQPIITPANATPTPYHAWSSNASKTGFTLYISASSTAGIGCMYFQLGK